MLERAKILIEKLRCKASDAIASAIATWTFIVLYTGAMLLWIVLHKLGVLHIDSEDFIKYNLLLSWAAGIQASIVLMASNRQNETDRKAVLQGSIKSDITSLKLTKKLNTIANKLDKLEEVIGLMEDEEYKNDPPKEE